MYGANSKVLGDQMRMNQEMDNKYYLDSIATMNDAQIKNISLYDTQQQRQNQAISNTREATLAALNSYSDKIVKNTASNRKLGIYENMYNYRFDPVTGRAINYNAPHQFNYNGVASTDKKASLPEGYEYLYDSEGNPTDVRKKKETKTKDSRNGSIVKSLKSL
jgi:cell division protein ZapA (FtsZ GTPase activity inhibitor)